MKIFLLGSSKMELKKDKLGSVSKIDYGFWDGPSYSSDYVVSWEYDKKK